MSLSNTSDETFKGAIFERYYTPASLPNRTICRRIRFPAVPQFEAALDELVSRLGFADSWLQQEETDVSADEMSAVGAKVFYDYARSYCMIGSIVPVILSTLPEYMLPCDGSQYSAADYPELYEVLDPIYRTSETTFRTPDLRGLTVIGANDIYPVDSSGGTTEHTLTVDEMPAHAHSTEDHLHTAQPHAHLDAGHTHTTHSHVDLPVLGPGEIPVKGPGLIEATGIGAANIQPEIVTIDPANVTVNETGGGVGHNNMQPYRALKYALVAR